MGGQNDFPNFAGLERATLIAPLVAWRNAAGSYPRREISESTIKPLRDNKKCRRVTNEISATANER